MVKEVYFLPLAKLINGVIVMQEQLIQLVFFGAGGMANYLRKYLRHDRASIVAYMVTENKGDFEEKEIEGVPIVPAEQINEFQYDYIILAFSNVKKGKKILIDMGISEKIIVGYSFTNGASTYTEDIFQNELDQYVHNYLNDSIIPQLFDLPCKRNYICAMNLGDNEKVIESDYVREQTLNLIAKEIYRKKLGGNVAELGVFRGDFSKKINYLFPQKKLYLFDTFEGFHESDIQSYDVQNHEQIREFVDTSVCDVLAKMQHPEQCIIKKGWFPDSYDLDDDERFAFVSIDADLHDPILAGLEIFYPKLLPGGYIMIHDYNTIVYEGAKRAVIEYCDSQHISYVPLCDVAGTVVITK